MSNQRSPLLPLLGVLVLVAAVGAWLFSGDEGGGEIVAPTGAETPADGSGPLPDPSPTEAGDAVPIPPSNLTAGEVASSGEGPRQIWDDPVLAFGFVVDTEGNGQGDVDINLFDSLGVYSDSEITEDDGYFEIYWDEPLLAGWAVGTDPDPYAEYEDPYALAPAMVVVDRAWKPGDEPVELELVLQTAARVRGRVVDARTGLPVEFADVEIVSTHPAWIEEYQDAFTEEDGSFEMSIVDLPREQLIVRAMDDDGNTASVGPFDLEPSEVRFVELFIEGGREISGTVRDLAALPVDGAEVVLLPLHPDLDDDQWDITLEDGSFTFTEVGSQSDQFLLYAQADGLGPMVTQLSADAGQVDVTLGQIITLAGTVVDDETGEPVDGADLTFTLLGPGGPVEDYEDYGFSEEDGRFRVDMEYVPVAMARVVVESSDHAFYVAELADLTELDPGALFHECEIRLQPLP